MWLVCRLLLVVTSLALVACERRSQPSRTPAAASPAGVHVGTGVTPAATPESAQVGLLLGLWSERVARGDWTFFENYMLALGAKPLPKELATIANPAKDAGVNFAIEQPKGHRMLVGLNPEHDALAVATNDGPDPEVSLRLLREAMTMQHVTTLNELGQRSDLYRAYLGTQPIGMVCLTYGTISITRRTLTIAIIGPEAAEAAFAGGHRQAPSVLPGVDVAPEAAKSESPRDTR